MKKRVVSLILLAASALTVTLCAVLQAQSQRMADKIIRLHVVANSDTSADQAVKLAVRDAVLREAGRVLDGAEDPKQAVAAQLPALEAAANAELQRQGSEDLARVSFRRELFPTREYDTFSLPAGVYDSLRVTIDLRLPDLHHDPARVRPVRRLPPHCPAAAADRRPLYRGRFRSS